jgi:hypothetical protein
MLNVKPLTRLVAENQKTERATHCVLVLAFLTQTRVIRDLYLAIPDPPKAVALEIARSWIRRGRYDVVHPALRYREAVELAKHGPLPHWAIVFDQDYFDHVLHETNARELMRLLGVFAIAIA